MNPVWLNYALLAQFAVLCAVWLYKKDYLQAMYWFGSFACTAGATLRPLHQI